MGQLSLSFLQINPFKHGGTINNNHRERERANVQQTDPIPTYTRGNLSSDLARCRADDGVRMRISE
jgi:hypothetical protein